MKKQILLLLVFVVLHIPAFAIDDPFNTYLWNRENALQQNGEIDSGDWFEWWYFKVVDPQTREAFFFTYGVVNPWGRDGGPGGAKAILQIGDFKSHSLIVKEFPIKTFTASYEKTALAIAENTATNQAIKGDVTKDGHHVIWDLAIDRNWRFNAMGWTEGLRDVSGIYWYPAQASATISGVVNFDGREVKLVKAPGYQDRNWGRSFPKWWTWLTSNHFKDSPDSTLAAGGGAPEILNTIFLDGLCIGFKHGGREYTFRSFDLDKIDFDIHWGVWNVNAENGRGQRIQISAYASPEQFLTLPFQSPRGPMFYDYEALLGHMTVKLSRWSPVDGDWKVIADLVTEEAGIEWGSPDPVQSIADPAVHWQSHVPLR
jgi:tocopherol cyclase